MTTSVTPPTPTYPINVAHTIEYFEKGIDQGGPYYRVQYLIDRWADTDGFLNFLLGFTTLSGGTSGTAVKRAPHQHPLSPNLFCVGARVKEGLGAPVLSTNGFPNYSGGAVIEAEYRPMVPYPYTMTPSESYQQIDPATPLLYCTQEVELTTETILLPGEQLYFQATGWEVGYPFKYEVGVSDLSLTFHKVPYMPMTIVRTLRSRVNNATFLGAAQGTVLFRGASIVREFDTSGDVTQKVRLTFKEREQHWNKMLNPYTMTWDYVTGNGGQLPYTESNLSPLVAF